MRMNELPATHQPQPERFASLISLRDGKATEQNNRSVWSLLSFRPYRLRAPPQGAPSRRAHWGCHRLFGLSALFNAASSSVLAINPALTW